MPFFSQMTVERQSAPTHTGEVRTRRRGRRGREREGDSGLTLSFCISRGHPQGYRQQSLRQQYHAGRMMHPAELCSPLLPSSLEIQIWTTAAQINRSGQLGAISGDGSSGWRELKRGRGPSHSEGCNHLNDRVSLEWRGWRKPASLLSLSLLRTEVAVFLFHLQESKRGKTVFFLRRTLFRWKNRKSFSREISNCRCRRSDRVGANRGSRKPPTCVRLIRVFKERAPTSVGLHAGEVFGDLSRLL